MHHAPCPQESIYSLLPEKQVVMEKPPMYRSIHSGTCPPTGSTFCTKSNVYNCGIYNLGGSTDGALRFPRLVQSARDPTRDASAVCSHGPRAACSGTGPAQAVQVAQTEAPAGHHGCRSRGALRPV